LEEIGEHRVGKYGVRVLRRRFAPEVCELPPLPRWPNGSSKLLESARSFFERLLSQQIELQTSLSSDVSAAQRDIRHLCLEHLLTIRDDAADFNSKSQSHEAHNGFLMMIDQRLRELCCQKFLEPSQLSEVSQHQQQLGHIAVLVQGAAAVLNGQEPDAASFQASQSVPKLWLLRCPFPSHRALLVRLGPEDLHLDVGDASASTTPSSSSSQPRWASERCEMRLLREEDMEDFQEEVGVVWDHSKCVGREVKLAWEIAKVMPPLSVLEELQTMEKGSAVSLVGIGGSAGIKSPLGQELVEHLERRKTAPTLRPVGLMPRLPVGK